MNLAPSGTMSDVDNGARLITQRCPRTITRPIACLSRAGMSCFVIEWRSLWFDLMANLDLNQRPDLDRIPTI